ncbi:MATE family efflux transporter [Dinoroseobacter shibae]|jgi:MATE family multidrug resistance protein|nr:MATE family efflux transporter [Dinoroseobacter shibae]URF47630.1 MATE family efflux transporter [Dinoroseobacter shibae]URF51940.1 MATE family efflux transporter [Dinoroseobacter shibae]
MSHASPIPTTISELAPLLRLSIPLMIGLAAPMLIGVIDTVMIAPLGTEPLAAAGITTSVVIILLSSLWGLVTMTGIRIAQAEGAGDRPGVAIELKTGLWLSLAAGGLGMALMLAILPALGLLGQPDSVRAILPGYWVSMAVWLLPFTAFYVIKGLFDAVDRPWAGVALSYLGVVVNLPLNWLLIYPAGLGLLGAGLASILSQTLALGAAWLVWRRAKGLAPWRVPVPAGALRLRAQIRDGWPLVVGYAGEGGAYALIGLMMGWVGATALAANQIVHTVGAVGYVFPLGMAMAASIRVGLAHGAGQTGRLRAILRAALTVVTGWMILLMAFFLIAGDWLSGLLSDDPEVVALAATLFIALACMQIADGVQSTSLGALRGMGDMRWPTAMSLIAYWPLALPAAYALGFWAGLGALGLWVGFGLGLAIAAIMLPLRFWHLTGRAPAMQIGH